MSTRVTTLLFLAAACCILLLIPSPAAAQAPDPGLDQTYTCPNFQVSAKFTIAAGQVQTGTLPAAAGVVVEVRSPGDEPVGCITTTVEGQYGPLYVYGEDLTASPPITVGIRDGESTSFYVDGLPVAGSPELIFHDDQTTHQVDLLADTAAPCYALNRSHTGQGFDPVAAPANSLGCAVGWYHTGQTIRLAASPNPGWHVVSWSGTNNNATTASTNVVTMQAATRYVSVNYAPYCYQLTRTHTGQGADPVATPANSSGCGIGQYSAGQVIKLTANPARGWQIGSWNNTDYGGSGSSNQVTMPAAARTVRVNYVQACYQLTRMHTGQGADPVASPANASGCSTGQYHAGELVTLTAGAAGGWHVASWDGTNNNSSTSTTNQVSMPAGASTVRVNYAPPCFALTRTHTGQGADPVASPANSSGCGTGWYHAGQIINLTAGPAGGWHVAGWTGTKNDGSAATTNQVTMPGANHNVSVRYVQSCYQLTRTHTGQGADPVASPASSSGCNTGQYHAGELITLTAGPAGGWHITSWSGTNNNATPATTNQVSMPAGARTTGVNYTRTCYELIRTHAGQGADPVPTPANSPGCGTNWYNAGQVISLAAAPAVGWHVTGWTGTDNNNSVELTNQVTMPIGNRTVSVNYSQSCYLLTGTHAGQGTDPIPTPANSNGCGAGWYHAGEVINLAASPAGDWHVGAWNGTANDASAATTNQVTMPGTNHTVSVIYAPPCFALPRTHTGQGADPVATPPNSTYCSAGQYNSGQVISLAAGPATGWHVANWTGTDNDASTDPTNQVTMPAGPHSIAASYAQSCYALTIAHSGPGADPVPTPSNSTGCNGGQYHFGELISLAASPESGWEVIAWTGTGNNANKSTTNQLTMPAAAQAVAVLYGRVALYLPLARR
jgi:hypothetical protein